MTVESLRVGNDTKLARFNIRTTATDQDSQQEKDKVKNKIIEAFGPALAKVEMTVGDGEADPQRGRGRCFQDEPRAHHAIRRRPGVSSEFQHHGFQ